MNITEFQRLHGEKFEEFKATATGRALFQVIDTCSLSRQAAGKIDGDAVVAGQVFYWQIQGWEKLRKLLATDLSTKPNQPASEPDYAEPPIP